MSIWDQDEYRDSQYIYEDSSESHSSEQEDYYEEDSSLEESGYQNEEVFLEDFLPDQRQAENHSEIINNARVRLEQGRLYEMLIEHNLFEGVQALPQAIKKVEKEIKEFITERLEILLGIKQEKEKSIQNAVSDFNPAEIQALKMVAAKITKGSSYMASSHQEESQPAPKALNPIKKKEEPQSIRPVQQKQPVAQRQQAPQKQQIAQRQPVPQKQQQIQKKTVEKPNVQKDGIAKAVEKDIKHIKNLQGLSLEEANKLVSQRHSRPMPQATLTAEQANMIYAQKAQQSSTTLSPNMSALVAKLTSSN